MSFEPLASRMRPTELLEFFGQEHILAPGKPLFEAILHGHLHSMILWGPPGSGKTTLANIIAGNANAQLISLSAVMAGVKDIRQAIEQAQRNKPQATILFIDEVHRFNKAQQDAFLPFVENGTVMFIGATTENPSFELNNALLSRARVYVLKRLTEDALVKVIKLALTATRGLANETIQITDVLCLRLAQAADGDARRALNFLELSVDLATSENNVKIITTEVLQEIITGGLRQFDKQGEDFYNQISALHKSVRGSDPDAALYWFARMIDGGCDPLYIARRVVRMASEDIGNADPKALNLALAAWDAYERLGSPEGELTLAQAIVYMSITAKSNAVYVAFQKAMRDAKANGSLPVPLHLRNAPTKLMRDLDYGKDYHYAHNYENAYVANEKYFPNEMRPQRYYEPVPRGLEIKIAEKLQQLRKLSEKVDD